MCKAIESSKDLVIAINAQLGDRHFRDSLRTMHDAGYPLVKMVEVLGLEEDLTPALLEILDNLAPEVVDGMRRATLDMLDREERALPVSWDVTGAELDCAVVDIEIVETVRGRVINVRSGRPEGPR